jgi:hypothetical protein
MSKAQKPKIWLAYNFGRRCACYDRLAVRATLKNELGGRADQIVPFRTGI